MPKNIIYINIFDWYLVIIENFQIYLIKKFKK